MRKLKRGYQNIFFIPCNQRVVGWGLVDDGFLACVFDLAKGKELGCGSIGAA